MEMILKIFKINSKACPLVAKTKINNPFFHNLGENIDVRTDIPLYNIYKKENYLKLFEI